MAYVITRTCQGTCDTACVDVCPCDCIHGPIPLEELRTLPRDRRALDHASIQLFIDPDDCIDCGACMDECPVEAIYHEDEVPADRLDDIRRNAQFFADRHGT